MHKRLGFLFVVLVALAVFGMMPFLLAKKTPVPRLVPQMFPLFVVNEQDGLQSTKVQGTGMLINKTRGYVVTAKHVVESLPDNPDFSLYAKINGTLYPLEVVWQHQIADIAVLQFPDNARPPKLPRPLAVTKELPRIASKVRLLGYLYAKEKSKSRACELMLGEFYCEKGIPLTVKLLDTPIEIVSLLRSIIAQLNKLAEIAQMQPLVQYDDLFYDHHIVANVPESEEEELYYGMSGGALVDRREHMLGIFIGFEHRDLFFVPAREIPDEYLPRPSQ